MLLILQILRQARHLLVLPPPLIRVQKWQKEHFTGSQADAPSQANSKKTEINLVVIWFT